MFVSPLEAISEGIRTHSTNCLAGKDGKSQVHEGTELNNSACFVDEWFICVLISKFPLFFDCFWFLCTQRRGRCYGPIRTNVIPRERPDTMLILILLGRPLSPPNIMYSILFSLASQVTFHLLYGQSIVLLFSHAAALVSDDIVGKSRHLFV